MIEQYELVLIIKIFIVEKIFTSQYSLRILNAILNVESVSKSIVRSSLKLNKLQILIVLSPELEARFPFFKTAKDQSQAE